MESRGSAIIKTRFLRRNLSTSPHDLASEFCFRLAFLVLRFYEAEAVKVHRQDIDGDEHIEKNSPAHSLNMCG